jgi:uncharacterized membrane protein
VKLLGKKTRKIIGTLLLLVSITALYSVAFAEKPIISESRSLIIYFDGYVQVSEVFEINQTFPQVSIDLLTLEPQNLIIVDEQDNFLDYSITNFQLTVFSLGANQIRTSYFTSDLTFKTGKYWTIALNTSINSVIILPENTTIISLNKVPERIESLNNQITIEMSPGEIEILYIAEHVLEDQPQNFDFLPIIIITSIIGFAIFGVVFKNMRSKQPEKPRTIEKIVDTEKLFNQHKHLRPEEIQVINFLCENKASAYEAQIYEKLNLPRTTTWRLLKRLQIMGIINIEKSRRQNIITIRKKYLKKNNV